MTRAAPAAQQSSLESAILQATRDILAREGLAALSMRAVAERVGVSATAIYHYFPGKQALVDRVVSSGYRRFGSYLEAAAARHPAGSIERIAALGEAYIRFALENREYFRVLFSIQSGTQRALEELPEGAGYKLLRRSIVEAMDSGGMRQASPDVVALYLWSLVHGLVTLELACQLEDCSAAAFPRSGHAVSAVELFQAFRPLVADGLRRRDDEAR